LRTLRDAGEYVTALRKADQSRLHWQIARRLANRVLNRN